MTRRFSVVAALLLASAGRGADLTLPKSVQGDPGTFIKVPATTDGKVVKWYAVDPGLNLFPVDLLKDTKTAVVTGPAGTYRLLAYTDGPSDPAVCVVIVGQAPPPPPGPNPPAPADPFTQAVQAAYAKETDPKKAQHAAWVANVCATIVEGITPDMTTGALFSQWTTAIHNPTWGFPKGTMPLLSQIIKDDLDKVLGTSATAVVDQAKAKAAFAKYAAALGTLR